MYSKSGTPVARGAGPLPCKATFEGLLEAAPDGMVAVDPTGTIRFVNRHAESLFGYDRGALAGLPIETLVPDSFQIVHNTLRAGYFADPRARKLGTALEVEGRRHDGSQFPVDIAMSHLGSGDEMLVIAAVRDMTARNEAEDGRRQSDRMLAAIEFSGDAIMIGTPDGIITSWNPASEALFGYTSQEMVGQSAGILTHADRGHELGAVMAKIIAGQPVEKLETMATRKNGAVFAISMTISGIYDRNKTLVGTSAIARDVTEQRRAFEAAQRMAAIVEHSNDAIIGKTLEGIITSWNLAAERIYGYSSEEVIGKSTDLLIPADRADELADILARVCAGQQVEPLDTIRARKDGTTFPVSLTISPIHHSDGTTFGISTIARDLTEEKNAAQNARSLAAAEDLVHSVMGSAPVGIALASIDGSIRLVNPALCDLLGYDEAHLLTHRLQDFVHPDDAVNTLRYRADIVAGKAEPRAMQVRLVRADGTTLWVRRTTVLILGEDGQPNLVMVQAADNTAEHEAHEALAYQAFHDPLTGLYNRAWILDTLRDDLRAAKRVGTSVGTLFVDLDKFNVVNDSLGHEAGDEVLTAVADRISTELRPGDHLGRFGGDSFVIVVQDVQEVLEVERIAERVSASIAADLRVRGHRIVPTASIGIAISTATSTPESLLRDTDSALFRAKSGGRARWQVFDAAMHAQAVARLTVEDQLRHATSRGEFVVHYQPIVALADTRVVGHEALVRWTHPTRGLLSPGDFIEIAEDSGLITAIGAQVLDQVCALLAKRPDLPGPISVNVSPVQLAAPEWLETVKDNLRSHRVDPSRLVIEVTETAALNLADFGLKALTHLSRLGVGIHLDDFGTGYSSISVLRDLPVTGVKLDLRFVHDLTTGKSQANALAHGLSGLVNGMHLTGIAEGIETEMQARILRKQGWECGQGYYFGRPAAIPVTSLVTDHDLIA
jgi:diguanylate cyclase (GGDEF)-like protein/PAS domain S-box-containing protein